MTHPPPLARFSWCRDPIYRTPEKGGEMARCGEPSEVGAFFSSKNSDILTITLGLAVPDSGDRQPRVAVRGTAWSLAIMRVNKTIGTVGTAALLVATGHTLGAASARAQEPMPPASLSPSTPQPEEIAHPRPHPPRLLADASTEGGEGQQDAMEPEDWSLHFQSTGIYQGYPGFHSPFQGPNSLSGNSQFRETLSFTGFFGRRLPWEGEFYFNPEFNQGSGFNHTVGLAGFPNGEAQKAGSHLPKFNVARLFLRQTFGLGGEQAFIDGDTNQLAGNKDISRLTITAGKLSIPDLFDDNTYSHDPRTQFLNWSLMDTGAYDYAGDQKGFTDGIAIELNQKSWALRGGAFLVPKVSNSRDLQTEIGKFGGYNAEFEARYSLLDQPGKFRLLGWANRVFAGNFRETLANPNFGTDIAQTRKDRTKYGFVLNLEQAVSDALGIFSRYSWNDGKEEIISFTDIDQSFSLGMSLKGVAWGRPDDVVGLAGVINTISSDERAFLAAGGVSILIGDGQLKKYAPEEIIEAYYSYKIVDPLSLTLDYQLFNNPAYNADRGPVSVFSARAHLAF
jgi:high affinity Mn2+ porin